MSTFLPKRQTLTQDVLQLQSAKMLVSRPLLFQVFKMQFLHYRWILIHDPLLHMSLNKICRSSISSEEFCNKKIYRLAANRALGVWSGHHSLCTLLAAYLVDTAGKETHQALTPIDGAYYPSHALLRSCAANNRANRYTGLEVSELGGPA